MELEGDSQMSIYLIDGENPAIQPANGKSTEIVYKVCSIAINVKVITLSFLGSLHEVVLEQALSYLGLPD